MLTCFAFQSTSILFFHPRVGQYYWKPFIYFKCSIIKMKGIMFLSCKETNSMTQAERETSKKSNSIQHHKSWNIWSTIDTINRQSQSFLKSCWLWIACLFKWILKCMLNSWILIKSIIKITLLHVHLPYCKWPPTCKTHKCIMLL